MTPYEQGFMDKCAELGVDPRALVKRAGRFILGSGYLGRPAARFWELLRGSPAAVDRHAAVRSALRNARDAIIRVTDDHSLSNSAGRQAVSDMLRKAIARVETVDPDLAKAWGSIEPRVRFSTFQHMEGFADASIRKFRNEMLKVDAARLGLIGGVGAAGYGAHKAVSGKKGN